MTSSCAQEGAGLCFLSFWRRIFQGDIFSNPETIKFLNKHIEEFKQGLPDLMKPRFWHSLEDELFHTWCSKLLKNTWDYNDNFDFQPYIDILDFLKSMHYEKSLKFCSPLLAAKVMRYIAKAVMSIEKGFYFLDLVLTRVTDIEALGKSLDNIVYWSTEYKTDWWIIWKHMLDFFSEHRKNDLKNIVLWSLIAACARLEFRDGFRYDFQEIAHVFKMVLTWTHVFSDSKWRRRIPFNPRITLSMFDDDVLKVFFPNGVNFSVEEKESIEWYFKWVSHSYLIPVFRKFLEKNNNRAEPDAVEELTVSYAAMKLRQ
ncbi:hypothetical protein MP638_005402 [Amoeboaphelidium occidentale]|nr:hypothetical protein MP638_005402 [Amoeboaphelidium occidentale]